MRAGAAASLFPCALSRETSLQGAHEGLLLPAGGARLDSVAAWAKMRPFAAVPRISPGTMSFTPTSAQMLFMLRLVFGPSEPKLADTRPPLKQADLKSTLEAHGLIRLEKRDGSNHVVLTEQGWTWVQEHLDEPIQMEGSTPGLVLADLLPRLKAFLAAKGSSLGELLLLSTPAYPQEPPMPPEPPAPPDAAPLPPTEGTDLERFLGALRQLDAGERRFVPLAELRDALPYLDRPSFDAVALALQHQGRIALFRIDEPWRRSASDEAAAIDVAGNHYHSAYLKG